MSMDVSDFRRFAKALERHGSTIGRPVRQVVSKGALNIRKQLVEDMEASEHFKPVASSISYDLSGNAHFSEAEIGPVKGSPGSLANIAYFGSSRGGGTVPDPMVALEAEAPRFEKALADLVGDLPE